MPIDTDNPVMGFSSNNYKGLLYSETDEISNSMKIK